MRAHRSPEGLKKFYLLGFSSLCFPLQNTGVHSFSDRGSYDLSKDRDELKEISKKLHLLKEESKVECIVVAEENFGIEQDCENPEDEIDHIEDQFDKALGIIETA